MAGGEDWEVRRRGTGSVPASSPPALLLYNGRSLRGRRMGLHGGGGQRGGRREIQREGILMEVA